MNSAVCRILAGRLEIIRATILDYNTLRLKQMYTEIKRNVRLERVWQHGEDRGYLHDLCYDVQNKRLIVMISAFQAVSTGSLRTFENLCAHRRVPAKTRLDVRQNIRCMVGSIDTLVHPTLPMKYRTVFSGFPPTFTIRWDALSYGCVEFIIDLLKGGRDVPCQSRTNHMCFICIFPVQEVEGVVQLSELL
jgi:hypothetical protein